MAEVGWRKGFWIGTLGIAAAVCLTACGAIAGVPPTNNEILSAYLTVWNTDVSVGGVTVDE
jgi:hypothetical protein